MPRDAFPPQGPIYQLNESRIAPQAIASTPKFQRLPIPSSEEKEVELSCFGDEGGSSFLEECLG